MASSKNLVILIGNVGRDPEVKTFQNGGRLCSFSLATNERWKDKNTGEWKDDTQWHSIVLRGDGLIDVAEKYVKKGSSLAIEGKLVYRKWTDQTDNERISAEIVVGPFKGELTLLGGKGDNGGLREEPELRSRGNAPSMGRNDRQPQRGGGGNAKKPGKEWEDELSDDIPFRAYPQEYINRKIELKGPFV